MPAGRYGPRTDIVIGEEAAKQLEFLLLIKRAREGDQGIMENDVVEELIAFQYNEARKAFNKAFPPPSEQE